MRDDILKPGDQIRTYRPPCFHLFQPFHRLMPELFLGFSSKWFGGVFCPLRCGPDPTVSVEHGGKLFERLNADEPAGCDKGYRNNNLPAFLGDSEFLPTPRRPEGAGSFPQRTGWVLLLLFLPSRKVKMTRGRRRYRLKNQFNHR